MKKTGWVLLGLTTAAVVALAAGAAKDAQPFEGAIIYDHDPAAQVGDAIFGERIADTEHDQPGRCSHDGPVSMEYANGDLVALYAGTSNHNLDGWIEYAVGKDKGKTWARNNKFPFSHAAYPADPKRPVRIEEGVVTARAAEPRTLLLADDHDILYRSGVRRVLHPLRRHAENPIIKQDRPWEGGTIAYCSVHCDPATGGYQMWYQAWAPGLRPPALCYASSTDGLRWQKPSLGLFEFKGSRENNILMQHGFGAGVLVDPRDPDPARRYKIAYWDRNGTCVAFSPDGIHWTEHDRNPVIRGSQGDYIQPPFSDDPARLTGALGGPPLSTSDVTDPIWDPVRGIYAIYAKTWLDGPEGSMHWKRAVARTESKDFVHWSKPVLVAAPDELDDPSGESALARTAGGGGSGGRQLHSGPTFFYRGLYFMQLQVLEANRTGNMPDELALSRDGYTFTRPFRDTPFLGPLEDKTRFDASIIWSNATPVVLDDEIRFYYGAYGHPWNSEDARQVSGIGLATLPRDRFAGLLPTEKIGQVTLRELDLDGVRSLSLNADAGGGSIRVELLDESGYRVRGFSRDDCLPIRGDALRHEVRWRARSLDGLAPGKYRVRIHLEQAEVFTITLER